MTEPRDDRDRLLSRKEAAIYLTNLGLTMSAQTLARLFSEGRGPLCSTVGSRAKYWESNLISYFRAQTHAPRQSSSEPLLPMDKEIPPRAANDRLGLIDDSEAEPGARRRERR
ncbi:MAG TPA: hypothetical protein PKY87_06795 [Terricaulis sp.]|nr:hypothetical protein [Terricaulis sp.]